MAMEAKLGRRYARAFFSSLEGAQRKKALGELLQWQKLLSQNSELRTALTSRRFSMQNRVLVLNDVMEKCGFSSGVKRFLQVVLEADRMGAMESIQKAFDIQVGDSENVASIRVLAPTSLAAEEKKILEKKFSHLLGKDVQAEYEISKELIGGLQVLTGGKVYDGSVAGWLDRLEQAIA
jgi:F-type H+-transporting ATPase subunit delta